MALARTMLIAGGGGGFSPPALGTVTTLTAAPNGGYSHIQDPRAVYLTTVDETVFGYVDGVSGDVEIATWDNATQTITNTFTAHSALGGVEGNPDWHDNPAILRRSDGKLLTFYSGHSAAAIYRRISLNVDDAAWAGETDFDSSIGGTAYTYPLLLELVDEGKIYLFVRTNVVSNTGEWSYSTSTDGGVTWSAKTVLFVGATNKVPYWKVTSNGTDRIDVFTTDASMPNDPGTVKTFHFYYTGGSWFKTDGTPMGSPPFDSSDPTLVYDGSDGRGWPVDAIIDSGGNPRVLLQITEPGESFDLIRDVRYRSGAWVGYDVEPNIGGVLYASACYDHKDPSIVYSSKKVGSFFHMHHYRTTDNGVSWVGIDIEPASTTDSGTPSPVFNRSSPTNDLAVVWFNGTWVDYLDYSLGMKGLVL